jgi:hypothetical protein
MKTNRIFLDISCEKPIFYLSGDMVPVCCGSRGYGIFSARFGMLRLKSSQSFTHGIFSQLCDAVDIEFFHNLTAICLNSLSA